MTDLSLVCYSVLLSKFFSPSTVIITNVIFIDGLSLFRDSFTESLLDRIAPFAVLSYGVASTALKLAVTGEGWALDGAYSSALLSSPLPRSLGNNIALIIRLELDDRVGADAPVSGAIVDRAVDVLDELVDPIVVDQAREQPEEHGKERLVEGPRAGPDQSVLGNDLHEGEQGWHAVEDQGAPVSDCAEVEASELHCIEHVHDPGNELDHTHNGVEEETEDQ